MWVPAVRPEDEQPVKQRLNVGDHIFALGENLQQASLCLQKRITQKKQQQSIRVVQK